MKMLRGRFVKFYVLLLALAAFSSFFGFYYQQSETAVSKIIFLNGLFIGMPIQDAQERVSYICSDAGICSGLVAPKFESLNGRLTWISGEGIVDTPKGRIYPFYLDTLTGTSAPLRGRALKTEIENILGKPSREECNVLLYENHHLKLTINDTSIYTELGERNLK